MTQYTVIKEDAAIYVDRLAVFDCDMSGLPDGLHALQWNSSGTGHIEYSDTTVPNLIISAESEIESELGVSLSTLITRRNAAMAAAHEFPDI
jgi:hypothetical protein